MKFYIYIYLNIYHRYFVTHTITIIMNRDLFIIWILREFLNDMNLCKYIYNYLIDKEYKIDILYHQISSKNYLCDIPIFYPGFIVIISKNPLPFFSPAAGGRWAKMNPLGKPKKLNGITLLNRLHKENSEILSRIYRKRLFFRIKYSHQVPVLYDRDRDIFTNI